MDHVDVARIDPRFDDQRVFDGHDFEHRFARLYHPANRVLAQIDHDARSRRHNFRAFLLVLERAQTFGQISSFGLGGAQLFGDFGLRPVLDVANVELVFEDALLSAGNFGAELADAPFNFGLLALQGEKARFALQAFFKKLLNADNLFADQPKLDFF